MPNAFGINDDRYEIAKALNPSQVRRLHVAQARAGRSPGENAIMGSERSHRDLMDAAGGSIAARQANLTSMNRKGYLKKEDKTDD